MGFLPDQNDLPALPLATESLGPGDKRQVSAVISLKRQIITDANSCSCHFLATTHLLCEVNVRPLKSFLSRGL
jgi:hypothetical protein